MKTVLLFAATLVVGLVAASFVMESVGGSQPLGGDLAMVRLGALLGAVIVLLLSTLVITQSEAKAKQTASANTKALQLEVDRYKNEVNATQQKETAAKAAATAAEALAITAQSEKSLLQTELTQANASLVEALNKNTQLIALQNNNESALLFLSLLQERGRLVDFLMEDITTFSDHEVGAAARVVHSGCRKLLKECFSIDPVTASSEGTNVSIQSLEQEFSARFPDSKQGADSWGDCYRLIGKVPGTSQPHLEGRLVHKGWLTTKVNLPHKKSINTALLSHTGSAVIVPAEIEIH